MKLENWNPVRLELRTPNLKSWRSTCEAIVRWSGKKENAKEPFFVVVSWLYKESLGLNELWHFNAYWIARDVFRWFLFYYAINSRGSDSTKTCLKRPIKYKLDIMLDISTLPRKRENFALSFLSKTGWIFALPQAMLHCHKRCILSFSLRCLRRCIIGFFTESRFVFTEWMSVWKWMWLYRTVRGYILCW